MRAIAMTSMAATSSTALLLVCNEMDDRCGGRNPKTIETVRQGFDFIAARYVSFIKIRFGAANITGYEFQPYFCLAELRAEIDVKGIRAESEGHAVSRFGYDR